MTRPTPVRLGRMQTSDAAPAADDDRTPSAPGPARLLDRSAVRLREDLAAGELSAREVTEAALAAAQAHADLGAFALLDAEGARTRAAELDAAHPRVAPRAVPGPRTSPAPDDDGAPASLHGLPLAYKDLIDVRGMPTRFGSALLADAPPAAQDDPLALRLRAAGTVTLGKTTVPEFGLDSYSENLVTAPARNPLDPTRTAGGSSGGAAAAVAAGILPFAPGSDGGGSIRIPAAACGLVGLKPGRGELPMDEHADTVRNLTVSGPLAHTVEDAALLYDVMLTPEGLPGRVLSDLRRTVETARAGDAVDVRRIGVTTASPFAPDLEISLARPALTALTKAAAALDAGGHAVEDLSPYYGEDYHRDFRTVWTAGLLRAPLPEDAEAHVGAVAAHFLRTARAAGRAEIDDAAHRLEEWARGVRAQFAAVDVVMTPVLATAPPPVGHFLAMEPEANYEAQCAFTPYTSMVNVLGLPAVAVPVLRDERGLNWSVQLIGRPGTSAPLLALAAHLELLLAG